MNIITYIQTIYEEHLKNDLDEFKPRGKKMFYPFWLIKIVYYYIFFLPFYPIVYFIFATITQKQIDTLIEFQEKRDQMTLEIVARLGSEIDDGARFLTGMEDDK